MEKTQTQFREREQLVPPAIKQVPESKSNQGFVVKYDRAVSHCCADPTPVWETRTWDVRTWTKCSGAVTSSSGEPCIASYAPLTETAAMAPLSFRGSQFRAFVECAGQQATHEVRADRYLNPSFAGEPCYAKHRSRLYLCDYCLAFWCRCQQHRVSAWQVAVFLRNLVERKRQRSKLPAAPVTPS